MYEEINYKNNKKRNEKIVKYNIAILRCYSSHIIISIMKLINNNLIINNKLLNILVEIGKNISCINKFQCKNNCKKFGKKM